LGDDSDFFVEFFSFFPWVQPEDSDGAFVSFSEAFEYFYGCGFACAVGSEESEDFAFVYGECDAVYGF
jgi:hypothetical protein